MRVALFGLGTVGGAVAERILVGRWLERQLGRVELTGICVRDLAKPRPAWVPRELLTSDWRECLDRGADVVVEAIGGSDPALAIARATLARGGAFVTANKEAVAAILAGGRLPSNLWFEAAVGGIMPVVGALRQSLLAIETRALTGILNGTCNFVLATMETGRDLGEAVREAVRLGYAEPDPSQDLSGLDAARKLAILLALAFGVAVPVESIGRVGLEGVRREDVDAVRALGGRVRLVAVATRGRGLSAFVGPAVVPAASRLGSLVGAENGLLVETGDAGPLFFQGAGAGARPTSAAVLAEVALALSGGRHGGERRLVPRRLQPLRGEWWLAGEGPPPIGADRGPGPFWRVRGTAEEVARWAEAGWRPYLNLVEEPDTARDALSAAV